MVAAALVPAWEAALKFTCLLWPRRTLQGAREGDLHCTSEKILRVSGIW